MAKESGRKGDAPRFRKPEELLAWLDGLEREDTRQVSVAIATRAALRIAPFVARAIPPASDDAATERFLNFTLVNFRATAVARAAAIHPARANELRDAADVAATAATARPRLRPAAVRPVFAIGTKAAFTAADAAVFAAATAGARASRAVETTGAPAGLAASAVYAAARTAVDAAADIWASVSQDAGFIAAGGTPQALASTKLWPDGAPQWAREHWTRLQAALPEKDGWRVWIDWYHRRLDGRADPEEVEALFATIPDDVREAGPAAANAWILERLPEAYRPGTEKPPEWDFFISYANFDEADAREVAAVLEGAGYSVFAQFKDVLPGSHFVREMQRGLEGSGKLVALYSPEYEKSDHCQAEWAAAYNSDPSGAKRKLIAFMLRPTALNALARQIVYTSLVGLAKNDRKRAILKAVAPKAEKRGIAEIHATLAESASPQPLLNADGKIDAGPNKIFDRPLVDQDLVDLPYAQRDIIKTIRRALPRQTPPVVGAALQSYAEHLKERGSQPIVRLLGDYRAAIEKEFRAPGRELWGEGLGELFERFFRNDALFETHFPLKNEESFADIPIDESKATGPALTKPVQEVAQAMSDAVEAGIATEGIGKITGNSGRFGEDIAPLPPDETSFEPGSRRVTLKRRFVLGTLGFFIAVYNLIGSTASIAATPQGAALLEAVRKAIESLTKFIL